tara:strand:+ start:155 stop:1453 length:1299 start_codon:yes stop_codon:yes gene_type:complete
LKFNIKKLNGFYLLKDGHVYDPYIGINKKIDVLIKNNNIIEIKKNIVPKPSYELIDCKNCIITNGFIDLHAHFREPGFEFKENLITGSNSAIYGGYTRVCVMPNTNPVIDTPELVKYLKDKSNSLPIFIYPIGSITKGQKGDELSEIGKMVEAGAVAISDDGLPVKNSQVLRSALEYAKKFNIPVINHAEDGYLVNEGLMHEGVNSLYLGLPGNPSIAESTMIYRDIEIAKYVNGKLHIPHISSRESLEVIKYFKDKNFIVSAEVTPHHLCLNDSILRNYDTNAKVAPPIRSEEHQKSLIKAIKSGLINCIGTDHAPHSIDDKETDIKHACCGMIGLESSFGLVNQTLLNNNIPINSIIDLFSYNPSQIINIKPNFIQENSNVEINIIDNNLDWTFSNDDIQSKSSNSPIVGMKLKGKVIYTFNKGFISIKK